MKYLIAIYIFGFLLVGLAVAILKLKGDPDPKVVNFWDKAGVLVGLAGLAWMTVGTAVVVYHEVAS